MVLNKDYLYPLDLHQMQISKEASRHPLLPHLNMTTHQVGGHGEQISKANDFCGIPNATQDFVTATDFVIYVRRNLLCFHVQELVARNISETIDVIFKLAIRIYVVIQNDFTLC